MTKGPILPRPSTTYKMNLNTQSSLMKQALEFRQAFNMNHSWNRRDRSMQRTLIVEEFKEFLEAEDLLYRDHPSYRENALKELADLVYVCYQYAATLRWDLDEALDRVHKSNMSKLGPDGKPIYREDGKVLKGPNYQPPNLSDLV